MKLGDEKAQVKFSLRENIKSLEENVNIQRISMTKLLI